jgi:hypothetical protein
MENKGSPTLSTKLSILLRKTLERETTLTYRRKRGSKYTQGNLEKIE